VRDYPSLDAEPGPDVVGAGGRSGFGVQVWEDGSEYRGEWFESVAMGKGELRHANGDVYIGEWQRSVAHGNGVYMRADGTKYVGQFSNDLQDGLGVETFMNGAQYAGTFLLGKKSGYGVYTWPDGSRVEGQWSGDRLSGPAAYRGATGRRYRGMWLGSRMHGIGRFTWPEGMIYDGQFVGDKEEGFGVYRNPDTEEAHWGHWPQSDRVGEMSAGSRSPISGAAEALAPTSQAPATSSRLPHSPRDDAIAPGFGSSQFTLVPPRLLFAGDSTTTPAFAAGSRPSRSTDPWSRTTRIRGDDSVSAAEHREDSVHRRSEASEQQRRLQLQLDGIFELAGASSAIASARSKDRSDNDDRPAPHAPLRPPSPELRPATSSGPAADALATDTPPLLIAAAAAAADSATRLPTARMPVAAGQSATSPDACRSAGFGLSGATQSGAGGVPPGDSGTEVRLELGTPASRLMSDFRSLQPLAGPASNLRGSQQPPSARGLARPPDGVLMPVPESSEEEDRRQQPSEHARSLPRSPAQQRLQHLQPQKIIPQRPPEQQQQQQQQQQQHPKLQPQPQPQAEHQHQVQQDQPAQRLQQMRPIQLQHVQLQPPPPQQQQQQQQQLTQQPGQHLPQKLQGQALPQEQQQQRELQQPQEQMPQQRRQMQREQQHASFLPQRKKRAQKDQLLLQQRRGNKQQGCGRLAYAFGATSTWHSLRCTIEGVPHEPPPTPSLSDAPALVYSHNIEEAVLIRLGTRGAVFRVKHRTTGRANVVKVLREGARDGSELQILRRLRHRNIAAVLTNYCTEPQLGVPGMLYIVMECCTGSSLYELLMGDNPEDVEDRRGLPLELARMLSQQAARAIAHCHSKGVCHRDVKLDNFYLSFPTGRPRLKLVDFGLARTFAERDIMHTRVGTPHYIAPEVLAGRYNEKCDVWSLGVIIFLLCVGIPPFPGRSDREIGEKVVSGVPEYNEEWVEADLSQPRELLTHIFVLKVASRPSAEELLAERWFSRPPCWRCLPWFGK